MRFLYWSATALVALVLVIFAVSNRATITLTFWPLPALVEAPLYLVMLATLAIGFVFGQLVAWFGGSRRRGETRALRRRMERLERGLGPAPQPAVRALPRR